MGVCLIFVGVFGTIGSTTGRLPSMLAAFFAPGDLEKSKQTPPKSSKPGKLIGIAPSGQSVGPEPNTGLLPSGKEPVNVE